MNADPRSQIMAEGIKQEKIRRAILAGPSCVTSEATVAELNQDGSMTVLRPGTNEWICIPGDQNIVGAADMCADPMGMVWMSRPALDAHLAVRRDGRRDGHHHARRRHHGHVRRHTVCPPAHLRLALGRDRVPAW